MSQRFLALLLCVQATVVFPAGAGESVLHPDGLNPDPGWALSRVGQEFSADSTFSYPDTTIPVRLYLIDTAVADPASFVAANPKLTFEGPILVRGNNDPQVSTPRAHGTQMLSLIAGVKTGVAPGTPIHVVNYDIYPTETTSTALLNQAIIKAIQHHRASTNPMRAAICIATSSTSSSLSYAVGDSINAALAEGIPVILSAGNLGQNAATIVPSANGTKDGVICVGASGSNDLALSSSNFGTPVDVLAPGSAVRTTLSGGAEAAFVAMDGTSPAAALVAGSVLAELSINGSLTPAQVESAIKASAKIPTSGSGPGVLRLTYTSTIAINNPDGPVIPNTSPVPLTATAPIATSALRSISSNAVGDSAAITPSVDSDSDGIPDMIEIFHSGNCDRSPAAPVLSLTANQQIQYKFPIAFELFNRENPFELDNGYTWGIRCTSDFKTWDVPIGSLSKTTDSMGQNWLTATFPGGQPSCFVQIEIHPPAP